MHVMQHDTNIKSTGVSQSSTLVYNFSTCIFVHFFLHFFFVAASNTFAFNYRAKSTWN